jgi:hypothetical protein
MGWFKKVTRFVRRVSVPLGPLTITPLGPVPSAALQPKPLVALRREIPKSIDILTSAYTGTPPMSLAGDVLSFGKTILGSTINRLQATSPFGSTTGIPGKVAAAATAGALLVEGYRRLRRKPIPVGATTGEGVSGGRMMRGHIGRFSGQAIPRGTKERISRSGAIILSETHRARGLSGRDLKGFNKTIRLLRSVGMVPKKLHVRHGFHRRKK